MSTPTATHRHIWIWETDFTDKCATCGEVKRIEHDTCKRCHVGVLSCCMTYSECFACGWRT